VPGTVGSAAGQSASQQWDSKPEVEAVLALVLEQTQQQGKKKSNNQLAAKVTTLASHIGSSFSISTVPSNNHNCNSGDGSCNKSGRHVGNST